VNINQLTDIIKLIYYSRYL